jgi:hypothetical protein
MLKQIIILIALSAFIVIFMSYTQEGVQWLVNAHEWMLQVLSDVFSGGQAGSLAKGLLALTGIPFLAGLLPALVYWVMKRNWFPYFMQVVWVVWLIQAGALIILFKAAG